MLIPLDLQKETAHQYNTRQLVLTSYQGRDGCHILSEMWSVTRVCQVCVCEGDEVNLDYEHMHHGEVSEGGSVPPRWHGRTMVVKSHS